ncbi:TPA: type II secretion system protein GspL [Enterobacter cancerogenus]
MTKKVKSLSSIFASLRTAAAKSKTVNVPSTKLLIRLPESAPNVLEWVEHDECGYGPVQGLATEQLSELAAHPAAGYTHLLIPAQKAVCRIIDIPDENYELTDQKLQWLADETLDDSMPPQHWTILSREGTRISVIGVDAGWLTAQTRLFAASGFNVMHATIDALCLPYCENGWTVFSDSNGWLLRTHENSVAHLTEQWLAQVLAHSPPQEAIGYGPLPAGFSAKKTEPACHILTLYPQVPPANLLHGKMRPPAPRAFRATSVKRAALCSLLLLAASACLSQAVVYLQLREYEKQLSHALAQQWKRYIPENRHTRNLRTYLPKQLQQRSPAPYLLLLELHSRLSAFPELALKGLNYDAARNELRLFISAPNEQQILAFLNQPLAGYSLNVDKHEQGLWTIRND